MLTHFAKQVTIPVAVQAYREIRTGVRRKSSHTFDEMISVNRSNETITKRSRSDLAA